VALAGPPPKFLIDEDVSPKLAELAQSRGYLGLLGTKDWDLLKVIGEQDWTLVTNNVVEFRNRYRSRVELHAGVVFLEGTDAGRDQQLACFAAALSDVDAQPSIINQEILVSPNPAGGFIVRRFDLP
jgi:Domain of unknown function (DUF5615)